MLAISLIIFVFFDIGWTFSPRQNRLFSPRNSLNRRIESPHSDLRKATFQSSSKPLTSSTATNVIYQKIIRPSPSLPDILFLGYLVEYLESRFKLPDRLPMIYKSHPCIEGSHCILAWDSPLSPASEATRMEVEVIGIYTDDKSESMKQGRSVPNMAMVVVQKSKSQAVIPPMMQNLFADSEKRILKALDRGLEDFIAGKIKFDDDKRKHTDVPPNVKTLKEAMEAELLDEIPFHPQKDARDAVMDTLAIAEDTTTESDAVAYKSSSRSPITSVARDAAMATMNVKAEKAGSPTPPVEVEDFAVKAARAAMQKLKSQPNEDFAVAAAKKIAASRQSKQKKQPKQERKIDDDEEEEKNNDDDDDEMQASPLQMKGDFKVDDYMGSARAFRTTVFRPTDRVRKGTKKTGNPTQEKTDKSLKMKEAPEISLENATVGHSAPSQVAKREIDKRSKAVLDSAKNRKINLKIVDQEKEDITAEEAISPSKENLTNETTSEFGTGDKNTAMKNMPSREQLEKDIVKAAQEVMSELASEGKDMTPEELLQDVLKFDEEEAQKSAPGSGFVSGAFEKAKELLQERRQKRDARLKEKAEKESATSEIGAATKGEVDRIWFHVWIINLWTRKYIEYGILSWTINFFSWRPVDSNLEFG